MTSVADNELLTRVGPCTPMGNFLLGVLDATGVRADAVGLSTGRLEL